MKALVVAILIAGSACDPVETVVGKARLPEADGVVAAPKGPTLVLPGGTPATSYAGPVRIAADRDVPYREVLAAADAVRRAGGEPFLIVANNYKLRALPPPDPDDSMAIQLTANAGDVQACISPPHVDKATCIARKDHLHVDRALVRQIVYQAVEQYHLQTVHVVVDPELGWADAVRAIDGARTCCDKKVGVFVEARAP